MRRSIVASLAVVMGVLAASAAASAPVTVCASGCSFTSIGAAVDAASDGDRILVQSGTYEGGVIIDVDVTIVGAGIDATLVTGVASAQVDIAVDIAAGASVKISGLTVDATPVGTQSAGIRNAGRATVTDVVVHSANSVFNAGVVNSGEMTLRDAVVTENFADVGGGIRNSGTLTLQNSTVAVNGAGLEGGGIYNTGTLKVRHTTISDNSAGFFGGGIFNSGGSVALSNVSFSNNTPSDCEGC